MYLQIERYINCLFLKKSKHIKRVENILQQYESKLLLRLLLVCEAYPVLIGLSSKLVIT